MTIMDDAWRHDELGWLPIVPPGEDFAPAVAAPLASNAIGIDVSSWQGSPNWGQVAATGRAFVYIKASEGTSSSYPSLDGQYQGARAAGLTVGLYHFAHPEQSPEANADAFSAQVNRLGAVPGHLPPCLDLETGSGDLSNWAARFIARLRQNTGCVRVMVYSSASFFQSSIREDWMDQNVALWIAHFGAPPGQPAYLTPRVAIHQYSNTGQVSGISGNVDLDFALWPLSALVPGAAPTPAPPAPAPTPTPSPVNNGPASVLTPDEQSRLIATYQQLSGSLVAGEWPGWPSWPNGSGRSLTVVDYLRQADEQLCAIKADVGALKAAQAFSASSSLSDADVARIATAVVSMLAQRMAS